MLREGFDSVVPHCITITGFFSRFAELSNILNDRNCVDFCQERAMSLV